MALVEAAMAFASLASPQTCDRPEWSQIAPLIGDWRVTFAFRTSPGHYENGVAQSRIRPGPIACSVIEETSGTMAGKPMHFLSVVAIGHEGGIERSFMDSEHGRLLHYSGAIEGGALALKLDHPSSPRFMADARIDTSDQRCPRIVHRLSMDAGKSWAEVLTFRFSPKSARQACNKR